MNAVRIASEAGLEIGVERQIGRFGEVAQVAQNIGAVDGAVALSCREGHAGACAGERREPKRCKILGRADIEGVGDHEAAWRGVQFGEAGALFGDCRHHPFPFGMRSESFSF